MGGTDMTYNLRLLLHLISLVVTVQLNVMLEGGWPCILVQWTPPTLYSRPPIPFESIWLDPRVPYAGANAPHRGALYRHYLFHLLAAS